MFIYIIFISVAFCIKTSHLEWSPDPMCPYPSDQVTKYQCYGNCSVYWACYNGSKFLVECPEGQEFDIATSECAPPKEAQCDPYISTTVVPITTNNEQSKSSSLSSTNVPITTVSSSTSSNTTEDSTTTTNEPYPNCPSPSEEIIYLPYKGDCTKYWECFEGEAYLYNCPDGLWWHSEVTECDYPGPYCNDITTLASKIIEIIIVSTSTVYSASSEPKTTQTSDTITCPNPNIVPVYFYFLGDCSKYWECFEGIKYINTCSSEQ